VNLNIENKDFERLMSWILDIEKQMSMPDP
jgi:hypothetical protein